MREKTEQERFWEGDFGDAYTQRNQYDPRLRAPFYKKILTRTQGVSSVCEFGANRGLNMKALQAVNASLELTAVEINSSAYEELRKIAGVNAHHGPIQDFVPEKQSDLVLISGVLIHVNPETLPLVYKRLFDASRRYVLINEYFNPVPVEVEYRGHLGRLFKRDFAGEFIDLNGPGNLKVVDYGFLWRRMEPQWDNATWVLLEKTV